MSIERERYKQMMQPVSLWQSIKRLFVFPPLSRQEAPAHPPSGGTSATKAAYRQEPAPRTLRTIAHNFDAVTDSLEQPLIGYLSKTGYRILTEHPDWNTMLYRDSADLNPKGGIVEVEIRVLRVIPEGVR
jgi:hypothetical protein